MKPHLTVAFLYFVLLSSFALGQEFTVAEYGLSIDAPSGWTHDDKAQFGFVIYDTLSPNKKRKFLIHFPSRHAATPEEQAQISLDSINQRRREQGKDLERIQYQKPVKAKSGAEGFLASHGFEGEADRRYINHYYFKNSSGRIVCICVYLSGASKEEEARLENIILNTLTFDPPENENG